MQENNSFFRGTTGEDVVEAIKKSQWRAAEPGRMECRKDFTFENIWRKRMDKGFVYTLEDEKIIEYMKLSTEDKLQWLAEINRFNNMVFSDREKELRKKLRACEI